MARASPTRPANAIDNGVKGCHALFPTSIVPDTHTAPGQENIAAKAGPTSKDTPRNIQYHRHRNGQALYHWRFKMKRTRTRTRTRTNSSPHGSSSTPTTRNDHRPQQTQAKRYGVFSSPALFTPNFTLFDNQRHSADWRTLEQPHFLLHAGIYSWPILLKGCVNGIWRCL